MNLNKTNLLLSFLILFISVNLFARNDSLRTKIEKIISAAKGNVGVAIIFQEDNDTLTFNGAKKFPMQSVYKFPLALAVLHQVDVGNLSLDKEIFLKKKDLAPDTWSPLREKYPLANVKITLDELISATVGQSDNNGCDLLFRLVGGPKKVNKFIHAIGINEIDIATTEAAMHKSWEAQYFNWCSPEAMAKLLLKFYQGEIVSKASTKYLYEIMIKSGAGSDKIKSLLPKGTIVAHKSGLSGSNDKGIIAASNDVGIITLPNGNHAVIAVFVSDAAADEQTCAKVIADVAKAVWDAKKK